MTALIEPDEKPNSVNISATHRREALASKWRSLPSLYWSMVVGVLTAFSVAQASVLRDWSALSMLTLLGVLLLGVLGVALVVAWRHQTPTEKLAMARALYSEGRRRFGEKDYVGAESAAARSADLDPNDCSTWGLLGRARLRLGNSAGAVAAFSEAIKVNVQPDWRTVYLHNRAVAYIYEREFGRARNDLDECVKEQPRNWTRLRWRALVNLYLGDYPAALDDARASVKVTKRVSNLSVLALVEAAANGGSAVDSQASRALKREKAEKAEDYYYHAAWDARSEKLTEATRLLAIAQKLDDKLSARAIVDPLWDFVRSDPQIMHLVNRSASISLES